ncbi:OmpA family protein [Spirosoma soli]|uniref:OmpA family protein n=1 Tax=Spirosoma soli TaxID=1770529 RepID=A0ABW5M422_9BACT
MKGLPTKWIAGLSLIESLALAQQPALNGLKGEYFNGPNFEQKAFTRTDPQVAFDWNWRTPAPGVQREYFSVRWTGKLYAPTSGKYRFSATVDDGVRVWVGGKKVIDEWRKQDDSQFVGEILLQAKKFYDLKIEYYNDWKGSVIYVFWETPEDRKNNKLSFYDAGPTKTIPTKYLFNASTHSSLVRTNSATPVVKSTPKPPVVVATKPRPKSATQPVPTKRVAIEPAPQLAMATPTLKPTEKIIELVAGEPVVLNNVFFAQSEYTLLPESYEELNRLVKTLQAQSSLRIVVAGHTDNVGDARLNQALSENRAKVVMSYLIRHGIAEDRLEAKGYGGSQPLTGNTTEGDRSKNRRVEIKAK